MPTDDDPRSPAERLERGLAELRARFVDRFPDRVEELNSRWDDLHGGEWSADALRGLHRSVHGLTGTAGSFGLGAVAAVSHRIELHLTDLLDGGSTPTSRQAQEISSLFERLMDPPLLQEHDGTGGLAHSCRQLDQVAIFEPRNLIVIVEPEGEFARELAVQLGHFGFELQMYERVDELDPAQSARRPAAVILDLSSPLGEQEGEETASRVREAVGPEVPVVIVSNRSDVDARLDAVRVGCSGYFVKPVDISEIVSTLDRITRSEPEPFRILIVDDERETAAFHAASLEAAGMETATVIDPPDVMAQVVETQPDVILMDVYMPSCSGLELAAVIRQEEAFVGIPIVFLSRETDRMKQIAALGEGGDDFFSKPVPPDQLVGAVTARARRGRILRQFMERDGLTGLSSHSRIVEQLEASLRRAERHGGRLAVAMLDIDGFKTVNDTHGHLVGDQVLKALAHLLRQRLRLSDFVGRFGGDEYLVVLPDTDGVAAQHKMDDIRVNFSAVAHDTDRVSFSVTLSCGVAEYPGAVTSHQLIAAADEALYCAKRAGKDRVFLSGQEDD